jgi:hypothetical protein
MHTIHNARISLMATACNNLGVAAIVIGVVAPLVRDGINAATCFVVWSILGLDFLWLANIQLGRLRTP